MLVRFGYVAMSTILQNGSPNKTVTATNLQRLPEADRLLKLRQLTRQNLNTQLRVLKYNRDAEIQVFRFTSKLVPLSTHPLARAWDYAAEFAEDFRAIGEFVREHGMRVSFHPDHFVNLNSPRTEVIDQSLLDLGDHVRQFDTMQLGVEAKLNIHLGGAYGDKQASLERFLSQWERVPEPIQERIMLENDDKTYAAHDVLSVCNRLRLPMVFDIHHYRCLPGDGMPPMVDRSTVDVQSLRNLLQAVFETWEGTGLVPKVHLSSPRGTGNMSEFRSHAEGVNVEDCLLLLEAAKGLTDGLDVMIEAKGKDAALVHLMQDVMEGAHAGIRQVSQASLVVR